MTATRIGPESKTFHFRSRPAGLAQVLAEVSRLGIEVRDARGAVWWERFEDGWVYQQVGTLWTGTTASGTAQTVARPRERLQDAEFQDFLESAVRLFSLKPAQRRGWEHYRTSDGADYWTVDVWHAVDPEVLLGRVAATASTIPPRNDGTDPAEEMAFAGIIERLES